MSRRTRVAAHRPWLPEKLKQLRQGWGLKPSELAPLLFQPNGRHYSVAAVRKYERAFDVRGRPVKISRAYLHSFQRLRKALASIAPCQVILLSHKQAGVLQSPLRVVDCMAEAKRCGCGCGELFIPNVPWRKYKPGHKLNSKR